MQFVTLLLKAGILEGRLAMGDSVEVRASGGGDSTGPNLVDRGKLCTRHALAVDGNGVPLVIHTAPVTSSDHG